VEKDILVHSITRIRMMEATIKKYIKKGELNIV
jgi:hypothetical protein